MQLYNVTTHNSKSSKTIVQSGDKDLTHAEAIANLDKHEKMYRKYGGEIKERTEGKLVVYDADGDETLTLTIEKQ